MYSVFLSTFGYHSTSTIILYLKVIITILQLRRQTQSGWVLLPVPSGSKDPGLPAVAQASFPPQFTVKVSRKETEDRHTEPMRAGNGKRRGTERVGSRRSALLPTCEPSATLCLNLLWVLPVQKRL